MCMVSAQVHGGAAWLMEALSRRDAQLDSLHGMLAEAQAEIAEIRLQQGAAAGTGRGAARRRRRRPTEAEEGGGGEEVEEERDADEEGHSSGGRRRRSHVHVPCPKGQDAAGAAARAPREVLESAANASGACPVGGVPAWAYLSGASYARFVKGVAARLRLVNGDTVRLHPLSMLRPLRVWPHSAPTPP